MAATAKFLFDLDFGGGAPKQAITPADHSARLAQAEQIAYRNGFAAGEARAVADVGKSNAATLSAVATAFDHLRRELSTLERRLETEAVDVAVAVARKLAPELVAREPLAEIMALASECFRHLVGAPHVVVRVADTLHEQVRDALAEIAHGRGFEGRLVVIAEPEITSGDCRIEWADGGVVRDRCAADAAIAEAIAHYLGARRTDASPRQPAAPSDSVERANP